MGDLYAGLTAETRRAILFATCYERVRQEYQAGFRALDPRRPRDFVETPSFKAHTTVCRWLDEQGWKITWSEFRWQGYIRYVFRALAPAIPQPGQLKNRKLLAKYIADAPDYEPPKRSREELEALYRRTLRPEITTPMMAAMGLRAKQ